MIQQVGLARGFSCGGACAIFGGLLLAGCATLGPAKSAEDIVLQRAQARWNAMVDRDFATAYKYLTPTYRATVPQRRYANKFQGPVSWESATAKSAKCEEKKCSVLIEISFRTVLPGHHDRQMSTHFDETWVLEEAEWFKFEPY